jgi:F0F1-type ATP synthase assembly protein I
MKEKELIDLWKTSAESIIAGRRYSLNDIQNFRKKKLRRTHNSMKFSFYFDSGLKVLLAASYGFLLIEYSGITPLNYILTVIFVMLVALLFFNLRFHSKYRKIEDSESVLDNLKERFEYYKNTHLKFIHLSAVSVPLFVLSGFFLYLHFKYGFIDLAEKFGDFVLLAIIILSWIIHLASNMFVYNAEMRELKDYITELDDPELALQKLESSERKRRSRLLYFSMLVIIGVILLWVLYRINN